MSYLTQMVEFLTTDNVRNWRFRLTLAYQMSKVITLYTPQEVARHHTTIGKTITNIHDIIYRVLLIS